VWSVKTAIVQRSDGVQRSHQLLYTTSSHTICTTIRRHSKPVASSLNRGFIGRENISSLASTSELRLDSSLEFRPLNRLVESWNETFRDLTISPAHHTRTLSITITIRGTIPVPLYGLFPALGSLRMAFTTPKISEVSTEFVPSPVSKIWRWTRFATRRMDHGRLPRPYPDSPGPSNCVVWPKGRNSSPVDCWTSQTVSASRRS